MSNDAQLGVPLSDRLLDLLSQEIHRILTPLVTTGSRLVEFRTSARSELYKRPDTEKGYRIVVDVECIDPARAMGRFPPFSERSTSGYFEPYVQGYVRRLLEDEGIALPGYGSEVVLQMAPASLSGSMVGRLPLGRLVRLADAVTSGALTRGSELHDWMLRFRLDYLLMSGRTISGPSPAMFMALESLGSELEGRTVIDLFAGSQGHALAARHLGAGQVICIDRVPPIGEDGHIVNPAHGVPGVVRVCADALAPPLRIGPDDVVIIDPYYEDFPRFCGPLLHRAAEAKLVVVNTGDHHRRIEAELGSIRSNERRAVERFGETVVILEHTLPEG